MSDKNDVSIHTKLGKSDYLYGPQMIDGIMRKPGKITIITDLLLLL